ncbi:MAG: hypothetical protein F9K27_10210 [Anaerolineae bacterium]|nr:MAG: hypothetical protein F9K27_10210 [Anaerolineae bacterium]
MWRGVLIVLLMLLAACIPEAQPPTALPDRPADREILHISAAGQELLSVAILELTLLNDDPNPDTQVLVVLTDGNGNPAYLVYPSNQPGVPEKTFDFSDYPLLINTEASEIGLWVLAFRHRAYPVTELTHISSQLAQGFDLLQAQAVVVGSPLALVVSGGSDSLLRWFGEIEVLGELWLPLRKTDHYSEGENRFQSQDGGFYIVYRVETDAKSPTPTPINTALPISSD